MNILACNVIYTNIEYFSGLKRTESLAMQIYIVILENFSLFFKLEAFSIKKKQASV